MKYTIHLCLDLKKKQNKYNNLKIFFEIIWQHVLQFNLIYSCFFRLNTLFNCLINYVYRYNCSFIAIHYLHSLACCCINRTFCRPLTVLGKTVLVLKKINK